MERRFLLPSSLLLVLMATGCRGPHLPLATGATGGAAAPAATPAAAPPAPMPRMPSRPGRVKLGPGDLAPVDAFISERNEQWVLGETVDVYASKEYFAPVLTLNAKWGHVGREERDVPGGTVITLKYLMHRAGASAMTNPRVLIGKGLTISARQRLTVHLMKTTDASQPVYLRVLARGKAVRGRKQDVVQRAPNIQLGGTLRARGGRWVWMPMR